jgi:hypothetical protein
MKKTRNRGRRKNTHTKRSHQSREKRKRCRQAKKTPPPLLVFFTLQKCRKLETGEGEKEHTQPQKENSPKRKII